MVKVFKPTSKVDTKIYEAGKIEQPKYYPNYFEWLYRQGTVITADLGANLGGGLIILFIKYQKDILYFLLLLI